jgi:hypothetical protein
MKYSEWKELSDDERSRLCQQLNPMDGWDLFKKVERAFLAQFGEGHNIESVFCGICGTVGPLNGIIVRGRPGARMTGVPKQFMGFPVIRGRRRDSGSQSR